MFDLSDAGYIKIARQIESSSIWERPYHYMRLWIFFLIHANWEAYGDIDRGELLSSWNDLHNATRVSAGTSFRYLSRAQVRLALQWFEKQGMISVRRYGAAMIVRITNYDKYQAAGADPTVRPQASAAAQQTVPPALPPELPVTAAEPLPATVSQKSRKKAVPEISSPDWENACKVIELMNGFRSKPYRQCNGTLKHIFARLREVDPITKKRAYTLEDLLSVVRFKHSDQKFMAPDNGKNFNPKTLFCLDNFERYLRDARESAPTQAEHPTLRTEQMSDAEYIAWAISD